ncbi:MAG: hypothetical protein WBF73_16785 [Bradyrhizobium sp.]|jgi:hypothetical protein
MSVDAKERIELLATCDLMRHLPAEQIEQILPCIRERQLKAVRLSGTDVRRSVATIEMISTCMASRVAGARRASSVHLRMDRG